MSQSSERVLIAGESLIDMFSIDSKAQSEKYERRPGGAPANVAVGLSRLGRDTHFWSVLGDDSFGTAIADRLAEAGVSDKYIRQLEAKNIGLAFVEDSGTFRFYLQDTARIDFAVSGIPENLLEGSDWVHIGGTLLTTSARDAICELAKQANDRSCTMSFDPNFRAPLMSGYS